MAGPRTSGVHQCHFESPPAPAVLSPDPSITHPPGADGGDKQADRRQDDEEAFDRAEVAPFTIDLSRAIGYICVDTGILRVQPANLFKQVQGIPILMGFVITN